MKQALFLLLPLLMAVQAVSQNIVHFADDSKIVFNSDFSGNHELYLLSKNTLTRLTDHPAIDEWPVADPSGKRIAFSSNRNGNFDIFVMDLASQRISQLTNAANDEQSPSWSSDGSFIYFDLRTGTRSWQTMKIPVGGGSVQPLFPAPPFSSTIVPFENPRSNEIYFTGKVLFGWVVAKFVKASQQYVKLAETGSCRPKVSPDGRQLAYVSGRDDGNGDLFLMNIDGSDKRNLTATRSDFYDYYPCFSPAGDRIVYSSSAKAKGKSAYQLYVLVLKTGKSERIFFSPGNSVYPYWFR